MPDPSLPLPRSTRVASAAHHVSERHVPYRRVGDGDPVVLVDGAAPPAWGTLPERLASSRSVITYARRGFPPRDDLPVAHSLREHADELGALLAECGPATVVGWSSGGTIALDLTLRRPDLVRGLVVLEPPLHARRHPTVRMLRAVIGAQMAARRSDYAGARRFLEWALSRTDGRPSDLGRLDAEKVRRASHAIVGELRYATGERAVGRRALQRLSVATYWLYGAASNPMAPRLAHAASQQSARIRPVEVRGAGHAIQLDAPHAVLAAVQALEKAA